MTDEKQSAEIEKKPNSGVDKQLEQTNKETKREEKEEDKNKKKSSLEADPDKSVATDPQENMEGPISSIMQNIKETAEANDVESKEEADKKKDENT